MTLLNNFSPVVVVIFEKLLIFLHVPNVCNFFRFKYHKHFLFASSMWINF